MGLKAGGLFTLKEAETIDGKPPPATGAPEGPHNTNLGGDVFLHRGGKEGGGEQPVNGVNEEGGAGGGESQ